MHLQFFNTGCEVESNFIFLPVDIQVSQRRGEDCPFLVSADALSQPRRPISGRSSTALAHVCLYAGAIVTVYCDFVQVLPVLFLFRVTWLLGFPDIPCAFCQMFYQLR